MNKAYQQAHRVALTFLDLVPDPERSDVEDVIEQALAWTDRRFPGEPIDVEQLRRDLEGTRNTWIPEEQSLGDNSDHHEWLDDRRGEIEWDFWERYRRYLEEKRWAPVQIRKLHEATDGILGRLENPKRPGRWDRRGMVVGHVQSGKTANYTGLICKAADAGYRLIVVLAGLHNSLRSQTQQRLDEEFLGVDTQRRTHIGVGQLKGRRLYAESLTSSDEKGDFQKKIAMQLWMSARPKDVPVLLVVKKNASVLRNLYTWATDLAKQMDPTTGHHIVRDVPLLVIDDEADNASVNTKRSLRSDSPGSDSDEDPTRINGLIRKLLYTFEKSAYVGYTATPFANIFIDDEANSRAYGEDLFPRSFVVSLRPSNSYMGVSKVFGLDENPSAGIEQEQEGLPIIREIADSESWLERKHRMDSSIGRRLPDSLVEAVNAFLLATAVRRARGQRNAHNSMLVHVTRFRNLQAQVRNDLQKHVGLLRQRLVSVDEHSPESPWHRLHSLWEQDLVPTTRQLAENPDLTTGEVGEEVSWEQVRKELPDVLEELQFLTVNGQSSDALTYSESEEPLTVVAVGGEKLSRGLTLEGLTVSYYLRASTMYDTLMQMGRWFGYRQGYLDVCRLYTTREITGWYRDIAMANEELLREFDAMAALGRTPKEYGLRVRDHPELVVTAAAKQRNSVEVDVSFSQTVIESISFLTDEDTLDRNLQATERLLRAAGSSRRVQRDRGAPGPVVWEDVPAHLILEFLESYRATRTATKAQPRVLAAYIREMSSGISPELTHWTVALVSVDTGKPEERVRIADHEIGLATRRLHLPGRRTAGGGNPEEHMKAGRDQYVIRRLVSPTDEQLDLDGQRKEQARRLTVQAWKRGALPRAKGEPGHADGLSVRAVRDPRRGLLLLYPLAPRPWMPTHPPPVGFAFSFPRSGQARIVRYRANNLWVARELGDLSGEDEEQ